jgi:hypothetical protein
MGPPRRASGGHETLPWIAHAGRDARTGQPAGHPERQWERFYRNNPSPTKQDLYDFAARMDKRYGKFFDPPVIIK